MSNLRNRRERLAHEKQLTPDQKRAARQRRREQNAKTVQALKKALDL